MSEAPAFSDPASLHVVAVFFNFNRFKRPAANFLAFAEHMEADHGVTLHRVELVEGSSPFQVTKANNPLHTQLHTCSEFFQKENLINIGLRSAMRLFPDAQHFAWIDADLQFFNPNLVGQTHLALERSPVVQLWSFAVDLDPRGHPLEAPGQGGLGAHSYAKRSFAWCWVNHIDHVDGYANAVWHTGYAWAATRWAIEAMGGLYEHSVVGSADHQMAWAWIGNDRGIDGRASAAYKADQKTWNDRAFKAIGGRVGCVDGLVHHAWHGRKIDRRYVERLSIIVANRFDPALDLRTDFHGLLHLTGRNPKLARDLRAYMAARNEDANTAA